MSDNSVINISNSDGGPMPGSEAFMITPRLRFVVRAVGPTMQRILQQMWQGAAGTQRWEDVPVEHEANTAPYYGPRHRAAAATAAKLAAEADDAKVAATLRMYADDIENDYGRAHTPQWMREAARRLEVKQNRE